MIEYRKRKKYKYNLAADYRYFTGLSPRKPVETEFIEISLQGELLIRSGYSWDGPSGPAIDTKNFLRASLVHDALYQLMRSEHLPQDFRDDADRLMLKICREAGMSRIRSGLAYWAVRIFASWAARPDLKNAP